MATRTNSPAAVSGACRTCLRDYHRSRQGPYRFSDEPSVHTFSVLLLAPAPAPQPKGVPPALVRRGSSAEWGGARHRCGPALQAVHRLAKKAATRFGLPVLVPFRGAVLVCAHWSSIARPPGASSVPSHHGPLGLPVLCPDTLASCSPRGSVPQLWFSVSLHCRSPRSSRPSASTLDPPSTNPFLPTNTLRLTD
jgi:hypothetical protein